MRSKRKLIVSLLVVLTIVGTMPRNLDVKGDAVPLANMNITIFENGRGALADYGLMIAKQLRELGIDLTVRVVPYSIDTQLLLCCHDYDLAVAEIDFPLSHPDPSRYMHPESYFNYHLLNTHMPYGDQSAILLDEALTISNATQRREVYLEWSNLVMDKVIPIYPLYNPRASSISWTNLIKYDMHLGLSESLPQMYFDDLHPNQNSTDELNLAYDSIYRQEEMYSLVSDNLVYIDDYFHPNWAPIGGLLENWEMHNETHYTFHVRDNVFWNPSYNITERDSNSEPLNNIPKSDLMKGLKNNEVSNGTNQQLTAKDVIFTLLYHSSRVVGINEFEYKWIKGLELNETNHLAFDLFIDANPNTPELDTYNPLWSKLSISCMPEFFLNSTDSTVSYTSGGIPVVGLYNDIHSTQPWRSYYWSNFGCGKYMLDYSIKENITVLKSSPYWHGFDYMTESIQSLNISTVNFRYIQNNETRLDEFNDGKLDIYLYDDYIPDRIYSMPLGISTTFQTIDSPRTTCLIFNIARPFIGGADNYAYLEKPGKENYTRGMAVRKAMCHAIDLDKINSELHGGQHRVAKALVHDYHLNPLMEDVFYYDYDIDTAYDWLWAAYPDISPTPTMTTVPYSLDWLIVVMFSSILLKCIRKRRKNENEE